MKPKVTITTLLWVMTIIPLLVTVATELNKEVLIVNIRVVDFFDLVFLAPFYFICLLWITLLVFQDGTHDLRYLISLAFLGIFVYGHSMHLTANAINTFSTEIRHYKDIIPSDTYSLIYFFDEYLGHYLTFTGLFGLLGMWILKNRAENTKAYKPFLAGVIFGLSYAVVFIESSQPWFSIIVAIWLSICIFYTARKNRTQPLAVKSPITLFSLSSVIFIFLGQIIYLLIMGEFVQPSQLGF